MNGELILVWSRTWQEVWLRLAKSSKAPDDLFIELVRGIATAPQLPASPSPPSAESFDANGELVDVAVIQARNEYDEARSRYAEYRQAYEIALNSEDEARAFFRRLLGEIKSEADALDFLEEAYEILLAFGDEGLTDRFRSLVDKFIANFNLRYALRDEFSLHATIPGVFSKLISEIRRIAVEDAHLSNLLSEFEEAFADLKLNRTQARMKTCLQKQFNLLEALGRRCPNVTEATLGAMCNQLDLPHVTIKEIGKKLYGFGSSYPGVRHAGDASSAIRQLDMRDFVSLSLMLASFSPYVTHGLDSDRCYTA